MASVICRCLDLRCGFPPGRPGKAVATVDLLSFYFSLSQLLAKYYIATLVRITCAMADKRIRKKTSKFSAAKDQERQPATLHSWRKLYKNRRWEGPYSIMGGLFGVCVINTLWQLYLRAGVPCYCKLLQCAYNVCGGDS